MDKRISGQYRLAHLFHARDDAFFRHQISSRVNVAVAIQRSVLIKNRTSESNMSSHFHCLEKPVL